MALELLAGPFSLDADGTPAKFVYTPFWIDEFGLVGVYFPQGGSVFPYGVAQLDGKLWPRNNDPSIAYRPVLAWDVEEDSPVAHLNYGLGPLYGHFDPRTGKWLDALVADGGDRWTRLADRYVTGYDHKIYTQPLSATSGFIGTLEYTFAAGSNEYGHISPARTPGQVWVGYEDGSIYLYDYVAQAQVGHALGIGIACVGLWYSRAFDVFISLHTVDTNTQAVRVWANEVRPASIAAPVALTSITRGQVCTMRTRVLGSLSEPVADMPVDWSLTGVGALSLTQSTTDTDGYATVDYLAPADATGGALEIFATVKF